MKTQSVEADHVRLVQALKTIVEQSERPLLQQDYPHPDNRPNSHGGRWCYRHEEMGAIARDALKGGSK